MAHFPPCCFLLGGRFGAVNKDSLRREPPHTLFSPLLRLVWAGGDQGTVKQ